MHSGKYFLFCVLLSVLACQCCLYSREVEKPILSAVKIDADASQTNCRTIPFLASKPDKRGKTTRVITAETETIPIGTTAELVCLLGMINDNWDCGVAHWGYHPELVENRNDQL